MKKLCTLFALLVTVVIGAWSQTNETISWTGSSLAGTSGTNVTAGTAVAVDGTTYKAGTISINSNKIVTESKKHQTDSYYEDFSSGEQGSTSTNATSTARIEFPITVADDYTFNVSEVDFKLEQGGGGGPAVHVFLVQGTTSTWIGYSAPGSSIVLKDLDVNLTSGDAKLVFVLGLTGNLNNGRQFKFSNISIKGTSSSSTPAGPVDPEFSLTKTTISTEETSQIQVGDKGNLDGISFDGDVTFGTEGIVSVNASGVVTPVAPGTTTINFATSAVASKYNASTGNSLTITVTAPVVATPTISPATFDTDDQEVTITCTTDGATIYYTTDGSDPTTSNDVYDPTHKPTISSTTTFKAYAVKADYDDSEIATTIVKRMSSAVVGNWDFTNWSDATKTGTIADDTNWSQYEKTNSGGINFGENGRSNKVAISAGSTIQYGTTNIAEAEGLTFAASAYSFGLIYNMSSATVSEVEYTYHGSQYLWLYSSNAKVTIPNVPAGAIIEVASESHNGADARYLNVKNGSTTLTMTQGATSGDAAKVYQVCKWTNTATAGDIELSPSKGLHVYYIKVTSNVETVPVTKLADRNYGTYVTTNKVDFTDTDMKAYIATGLNSAKTAVAIQEVSVVDAGTPIIVYTADKSITNVNVPISTAEPSDVSASKLVAGDGTTAWDGTPGSTYYYVASDKFKKAISGTLKSGKAYMMIATSETPSSLDLDFEEVEPTAVGEVQEFKGSKVQGVKKFFKDGKLVIETANGTFTAAGARVK